MSENLMKLVLGVHLVTWVSLNAGPGNAGRAALVLKNTVRISTRFLHSAPDQNLKRISRESV